MKRALIVLTAGLSIFCMSNFAWTEEWVLEMIKDLNPGTPSSKPGGFIYVNGKNLFDKDTLFFIAWDIDHGYELWKSDGTALGTARVKDINPGGWGSDPSGFAGLNGVLLFVANDGVHGGELWKSDGTEAGTVMVKDINPGAEYSLIYNSINFNKTLFFIAYDGVNGQELWKSDGTEAGTVMVKDINPGNGGSNPGGFTIVNGILFFGASDGVHGHELWKSDGTEAGTVMVKDINPGGNSNPFPMTNVNGTLFFAAYDTINGYALWKSDGTEAGTVMVKDIIQGFNGDDERVNPIHRYQDLIDVNGTLFFILSNDFSRAELWKSDGTEIGTVMIKEIIAELKYCPIGPTNINGTAFFADGSQLWKSDGTAAGTVIVKEFIAPPNVYYLCPHKLTAVNETLFFYAWDDAHGSELWKSDGTEAGTVMTRDIWPGPEGSIPPDDGITEFLKSVQGTLFFGADDGIHGAELWAARPTSEGDNEGEGDVVITNGGGGSGCFIGAALNSTIH